MGQARTAQFGHALNYGAPESKSLTALRVGLRLVLQILMGA